MINEKHLTLRDPLLGDVDIDRKCVRKIRWQFFGRRIILDDRPHHLGPKGALAAGLRPIRAEGPSLAHEFDLDAVPVAAQLRVAVIYPKGMEKEDGSQLRTEIVINDQVVDNLRRHVRGSTQEPRWLTIRLPVHRLRAGKNTLLIRQTPDTMGYYESFGLTGLVVEFPR
jgi:hypothetical protein